MASLLRRDIREGVEGRMRVQRWSAVSLISAQQNLDSLVIGVVCLWLTRMQLLGLVTRR